MDVFNFIQNATICRTKRCYKLLINLFPSSGRHVSSQRKSQKAIADKALNNFTEASIKVHSLEKEMFT